MTKKHSLTEEVAEFFRIDLHWLEHLEFNNFACGCSVDADTGSYDYCEEYTLEDRVHDYQFRLNKAIETLETFREKRANIERANKEMELRP